MVKYTPVEIETNGKGYLGFLCGYPGAYIRGKSIEEALSKTGHELQSYQKWLGIEEKGTFQAHVVKKHESSLMIEDADSNILLETDLEPMTKREFDELSFLLLKSGKTTYQIYQSAEFKDWIDQDRIRKAFYGDTPKTIREILHHIDSVQYYYLSRMMSSPTRKPDFITGREKCIERLQNLFHENYNNQINHKDGEFWTLKKNLRRFFWHDRIHSKSMIKILRKQQEMGIIKSVQDPFFFFN